MTEPTSPKGALTSNDMRSRLYFYNQLAATYTDVTRVRRERHSTETKKVPKEFVDSFLQRFGWLSKPKSDAKSIPVKFIDHDDEGSKSEYRGDQIRFASAQMGQSSGLAMPLSTFQSVLTNVREFGSRRRNRYVYKANDPAQTMARHARSFLASKLFLIGMVVVAVAAIAGGSFMVLRQQSINRVNASQQAQFDTQRKAWLCALHNYQQSQGEIISKEAKC